MTHLQLPHKVAEYACPINGLEDMYEWKTGQQLPGYFLMDLSMIGFLYLKLKNAPNPRIVGWGSGAGKPQHELLGDIMGYDWTFCEGGRFSIAWQQVCESIDQGFPVILGLLDMYHLPYYPNFYHRMHIPQHYVLLVGYDQARQEAYVQDNGLGRVQTIPLADLKEAWNVDVPGQGKKNTYCLVRFGGRIAPLAEIVEKGLQKKARLVLNPPVNFMGIKGMYKLAAEIAGWPRELTKEQMKNCLTDLVTFSCSVVPMPPKRLLPFPINHTDPHQGVRDRFAAALKEFAAEYSRSSWDAAALEFAASGKIIGELTDLVVDQIMAGTTNLQEAPRLIKEITDREEKAYRLLL